jgi:UDP-2,4-diacetamido-2,4,6-trideoxy-beta-L-altropyranose hydrolase
MIRKTAKCLTHTPVSDKGVCLRQGKPKLWIRTAAGPAIGFGHLRRTIALAHLLENGAQPVFLADAFDEWTRRACDEEGWSCFDFEPDCLRKTIPDPALVLIDTREPRGLQELLQEAGKLSIPVVSIHDLGLNPLATDVVIDGSVLPVRGGKPDAPNYLGAEYLVLDPMYAEVNRRPRQLAREIRSVFINLGGGDGRRFFPALLDGLRRWKQGLQVTAAGGFGNWKPDAPLSSEIRWARPEEPVWELFFEADVALTAGGLSSNEALCCGTPLLALSYDGYQQVTVSALAREGLCVNLGLGDLLDAGRIPSILERLEENLDQRETMSAAGKRRIDGRGAWRVSRILEGLLGAGA